MKMSFLVEFNPEASYGMTVSEASNLVRNSVLRELEKHKATRTLDCITGFSIKTLEPK